MKPCSRGSSNSRVKRLAAAMALAMTLTANSVSAQYYGGLSFSPLIPNSVGSGSHESAGSALDPGFSTPWGVRRNSDPVYGLRLSFPLASNLTIEGSYSERARANYGAALEPGQFGKNTHARGYGLDLVGAAPLFDHLSLFGRAGIQSVRTEFLSGGAGNVELTAYPLVQSATAARVGIGVRYDFSNSLGLRLQVEGFRKLSGSALGEAGADNFSFGVMLKF